MPGGATAKQQDFIESLAEDLGLKYHDVREIAESLGITFTMGYNNLTRRQASKVIEELLSRKEGK